MFRGRRVASWLQHGTNVAVLLGLLWMLGEDLWWRHHEGRIVEGFTALVQAENPRPVHVGAPQPGSFWDGVREARPEALEERVRELLAAGAGAPNARGSTGEAGTGADLWDAVDAVLRTGGRPPAAGLAAVEATRPQWERLMQATRRHVVGAPPNGRLLPGVHDGVYEGLRDGLRLALLDGERLRRDGRVEGAAERCLDALALGRDQAWGAGLLSAMLGRAAQRRALPFCARVIADAPPDVRASLLRGLVRIREAHPAAQRILDEDFLLQGIGMADAFHRSALNRLPSEARRDVASLLETDGKRNGWLLRLLVRTWMGRELRRVTHWEREMRELVELPEPGRRGQVAEAAAAARGDVFTPPDLGGLLRSYTLGLRRLELLGCLAEDGPEVLASRPRGCRLQGGPPHPRVARAPEGGLRLSDPLDTQEDWFLLLPLPSEALRPAPTPASPATTSPGAPGRSRARPTRAPAPR